MADQAGVPRLPTGLDGLLGGRRGTRAPRRPRGVAALAPVVALAAVPLLVAVFRQVSCAREGWQGEVPIWRQCGAPVIASLVDDGAGRGLGGYLSGEVPLDVPVLRGLVTTFLASLSPGTGLAEQRWFLVWWSLLAAAGVAALVLLVGTARGLPRADPVAVALSPVLALAVLLSGDLVAVVPATAAVWAWTRRRPELAGALVAVALLGGRPALVVLLALAVLPPPGLRHATRRLLRSAAITLVLVVGPVAALDLGLLLRPVQAWWGNGAGPGSLLLVPGLAARPLDPAATAVASLLGLLLAAGLVLVLAARRPTPPVPDVVLLGLVVVLLTGVSFPAGAALWLVPFVALAGLRWRDHLLWAGAEAVHLVAYYGWLDATNDPAHGLPPGWYATAMALRILAVGRLGWVMWARASWGVPDPLPAESGAEVIASTPTWAPDPGRARGEDWVPGRTPGTLDRLPVRRPVDNSGAAVGDDAYPPVTEGP